jgi:hypothetical protein
MTPSKGRNGLADQSMDSARKSGRPEKVKETQRTLRRVRTGRTGQAGEHKS